MKNQGLSLVELIIVLAVLLMLIAAGYFAFQGQLWKGNDSKRKDDLERVRVAFEDYFNDYGCYPESDTLNECNSEGFQPYLREIACDPVSNEPYVLLVEDEPCPSWFIVLAKMDSDSSLSSRNLCGQGCYYNDEEYGWSVTSENVSMEMAVEQIGAENLSICGQGCWREDDRGVCNVAEECSESEDCYTDSDCSDVCSVSSCN